MSNVVDIRRLAAETLVAEAIEREERDAVVLLPTDLNHLAAAVGLLNGRTCSDEVLHRIFEALDGFGNNVAVLDGGRRAAWRAITYDDISDLVGLDKCLHGDVLTIEAALSKSVGDFTTVGELLAAFEDLAA